MNGLRRANQARPPPASPLAVTARPSHGAAGARTLDLPAVAARPSHSAALDLPAVPGRPPHGGAAALTVAPRPAAATRSGAGARRPALAVLCLLLSGCAKGGATPGVPCTVGETRTCRCNTGEATVTCVAPEGAWTACGCPSRSGVEVAVKPAPPPPSSCGGTTCAPFTEEDTEVGAKGCCTDDGQCGASSSFIFGTQCVARGADPGRANDACPSESANFIDLEGCCRPDGSCGLSIDTVPNFDLGCLERTEMERLLNAGSFERDKLSRTFFLPVVPASFAAKACVF